MLKELVRFLNKICGRAWKCWGWPWSTFVYVLLYGWHHKIYSLPAICTPLYIYLHQPDLIEVSLTTLKTENTQWCF